MFLVTKKDKNKGFTLVELLVVVAILGVLLSTILSNLNNAKMKSRDAKRLFDMTQLRHGLELYYDTYGVFPGNVDNDCSGWDTGYNGGIYSGDTFIPPLDDVRFMLQIPGDPATIGSCEGYRYYRYGAGTSGCDVNRGAFFVMGVVDMESSGNPYPSSPGWSCPGRNWQNEMDWVMGGFEK